MHDHDYLQLGRYGELYVSTLNGAVNLLNTLRERGITGCHDQVFNENLQVAMRRRVFVGRKNLYVTTNEGSTLNEPISKQDILMLRWKTAPKW